MCIVIGQFSGCTRLHGPLKCKVASVDKLLCDLSPKLLNNLASKVLKLSFTLNCVLKRANDLRWFPSFALRISTVHDFCVISVRKWARARTNIRDFPQTKLDSEVNACFLVNEHGDPHFLFYKFNENNVLNNWEKNWQKSMATFFGKWSECYR